MYFVLYRYDTSIVDCHGNFACNRAYLEGSYTSSRINCQSSYGGTGAGACSDAILSNPYGIDGIHLWAFASHDLQDITIRCGSFYESNCVLDINGACYPNDNNWVCINQPNTVMLKNCHKNFNKNLDRNIKHSFFPYKTV